MSTPPTLQHAAACSGARVEQSEQLNRAERIAVTTWRCLDCGAFTSASRPLTRAEQTDADVEDPTA